MRSPIPWAIKSILAAVGQEYVLSESRIDLLNKDSCFQWHVLFINVAVQELLEGKIYRVVDMLPPIVRECMEWAKGIPTSQRRQKAKSTEPSYEKRYVRYLWALVN